jgi:cAMP-dependent protein kinase regulator
MALDWLAKGKAAASVPELLARKQFARAVELATGQRTQRPRDPRLRLQLADTLAAAGRGAEAVPILAELADELAREGFAARAIALLKRIQKIDPHRPDVERTIATLVATQRRQEPRPPVATAPVEIGMEEIAEDAPPPHVLFPDFSAEELVAILAGLQPAAFSAGDLVVAEGEPGESLFLLTAGRVKAWIRDPGGRHVLVRELGEGEFFGEISALTGRPRTATVVASSSCEMLELDRPTLDGITRAHPRVREVLQRFYEQRMAGGSPAAPGAV